MSSFRKIGICILFLLFANTGNGQQDNYYFKSYSIRDGLPNNHVRWITQDKDGFLWVATWDGLARFDGVEFKAYRHNPNDSNSIAFFEIIKVVVDSANQVWAFTAGKVCRYERNHDHFIQYDNDDFQHIDTTQGYPEFSDILIDRSGKLNVVFANGFYRFNGDTGKFDYVTGQIKPAESFSPSFSSFDNEGNLWYINLKREKEFGLAYRCHFDMLNTITAIDSFPIEMKGFTNLFNNATYNIGFICNPSGQVWMTSSQGLLIMEKDTFRLAGTHIRLVDFPGIKQLMWSYPEKGLMIYYPSEHRIDTLYKPGEIETVIAYYHDFQDNIWFSDMSNTSVNSGLNLTFRTGNYFRHYLTGLENGDPYVIFGLCKDNSGNIWAGGRPNDHIVKIGLDGHVNKIAVPFQPVTYYNFPRNIIEDDEGFLWISFFYDYLYRFDPVNNEFADFSCLNKTGEVTNLRKNYRLIHQLDKNRMVAAGAGKIHIFNTLTGNVISSPTIDDRDIFSIYHDTCDRIWFGLSGKLFRCDYNLDNQELFEISDQYYNIEDICPGENSDLWLAMLGGGIGHFDIISGKTTFYTTYNGLAHNTVYSIRKDHSGNLWVSHNLGISMFNPSTKSFTNYDEKDGLMIKEFDSEASYQTAEGELLFGGIGGIVSFYPERLKSSINESLSRLLIAEFRVADTVFPLDQPIDKLSSVILPKGTDNFQLEFIKPDFRNGDETRYRYRLKGSKEDWVVTDSKRRWVNYTSLRPGKYEFQVENTNLKGDWAFQTSLVISIPPYFYQTLLFKIMLVLITLAIILVFFFMKTKQIRLIEKKKQEQLRLETLRGQMNPHFIYNSLNSINYFISLNDRLNANQYITDFSRLMRAIMMNSAQEYVNMESEIQAIKDYLELEHLRFSNKFDYEILIGDGIDQVTTEITPSLVQPFIENAIWHGLRYLENRKGYLSVRFMMERESSLVCYIEDDGIGRKLSVRLKTGEQKKRKSRGIAIVEERMSIINSIQKSKFSLQVMNLHEDREETGTKVRIELPFRKPI
jgi:ligand-binding sensor domain-containing protein